jgi:hypothetical protein
MSMVCCGQRKGREWQHFNNSCYIYVTTNTVCVNKASFIKARDLTLKPKAKAKNVGHEAKAKD